MFSSMAKNKIKFSEDKKYHKWRRIGFYCLYAAIALAVVCIVLGQVGATVPAAAAGSAAANEQDQDENPPAVKAIVAVVAHNRFLLFQIFHSHTIAGTTRR